MPRIRWIEIGEATGDLKEQYDAWLAANPGRPRLPGILQSMSHSAALFRGVIEVSDAVHFCDGHLTRRQKEMIATYVSALNQCPY